MQQLPAQVVPQTWPGGCRLAAIYNALGQEVYGAEKRRVAYDVAPGGAGAANNLAHARALHVSGHANARCHEKRANEPWPTPSSLG